ncbi:hypothetical protein AB0D57_33805 [Streptomyces sp. NPDC048275]|uniref:hypothetical protein n=1 Tax=Streptomyces sp. NPDC048275 TaxID=3155629 RepID=UPI0033E94B87
MRRHDGRCLTHQLKEAVALVRDAAATSIGDGQPGRREPRTAIAGTPGGEVLITPQSVEVIVDPHRCGATRVAGTGHARGESDEVKPV